MPDKSNSATAVNDDDSVITNTDADNDGVSDDKDKCLGTASGVNVDDIGCPKQISDQEKEEILSKVDLKSVNFKSNSKELTSDSLSARALNAFNNAVACPGSAEADIVQIQALINQSRNSSAQAVAEGDLAAADWTTS